MTLTDKSTISASSRITAIGAGIQGLSMISCCMVVRFRGLRALQWIFLAVEDRDTESIWRQDGQCIQAVVRVSDEKVLAMQRIKTLN